jgi:hypothetical protein
VIGARIAARVGFGVGGACLHRLPSDELRAQSATRGRTSEFKTGSSEPPRWRVAAYRMKFMLTGSENSRTSLKATSSTAPSFSRLPSLIRGVVQLLSHWQLNAGESYAKIEFGFVLRAVGNAVKAASRGSSRAQPIYGRYDSLLPKIKSFS